MRSLADAAGPPLAAALAGVAKLRGGKAVHPHGVTYGAELSFNEASAAPAESELLSSGANLPAIVRFSRSIGLPRPLPDLLGMSIRVLDAYGTNRHQDFMLVTSVDAPFLHHIFVPARDVQQRPYSSSLPYRSGDRTFLVGTCPHPESPKPSGGDEFDRLSRAASSGQLRFEFALAPLFGRFERIGELRIGRQLPESLDALCFNPFNTGADLEPVGAVNRWRRQAYTRSQSAWGEVDDRRAAQERADEEMRAFAEQELLGASSLGSGFASNHPEE